MSSHQANDQMLGYLYQVRYALHLLLQSENPNFRISIEKFDDIAFDEQGTPKELIQLKHHTKRNGNLSDSSTDIWRTIKVWIDAINTEPSLLDNTKFFIITTAVAPEGSAASFLKSTKRDANKAYGIFKTVAEAGGNKEHAAYYTAFLGTDISTLLKLFGAVEIIDSAPNIVDVETSIRKAIRYSCVPQHENQVMERVEGWWFRNVIGALNSDKPVYFDLNQARGFIVSVAQQYGPDALPIDEWNIDGLTEENLSIEERIFLEQLRLIKYKDKVLNIALRDYYKAYKQRSRWVRDYLLYVNELDQYDKKLVEEWEYLFAIMEDDLKEYGNQLTDKERVESGRTLYEEISVKDIRIREKCQEPFVMRGSYHMLANKLLVGWRVDFLDQMKSIITSSTATDTSGRI